MLERLKRKVYRASMDLPKYGLVIFTWGNVSEIDRKKGVFAIKPRGVSFDHLTPENMIVMDMEGNRVEGSCKAPPDAMTHLQLYKAFPEIGGIVHTHSPWATSWAQSGRSIPCYGTTHADYIYGEIPCTRKVSLEETKKSYEKSMGDVIVETFRKKRVNPVQVPAVLCAGHGPFTWGESADKAVYHSVVLEEIAKIAAWTENIEPKVKPLPESIRKIRYDRKKAKKIYGRHL